MACGIARHGWDAQQCPGQARTPLWNPPPHPTPYPPHTPLGSSLLEEAKASTAAATARATSADQAGLRTAFGAGIPEEARVTSVP